MENLKKRLKEGEVFNFSSDSDMLEISFRKSISGISYFFIELNSKVIKMTKTFKDFKTKFDALMEERELILEIN